MLTQRLVSLCDAGFLWEMMKGLCGLTDFSGALDCQAKVHLLCDLIWGCGLQQAQLVVITSQGFHRPSSLLRVKVAIFTLSHDRVKIAEPSSPDGSCW